VDYAQAQRNPGKHLSGFAIVVVLHVILGYALVAGLGRKIVEVIKAPIETKIIEEVKPPPPPPPENLPPPPPKMAPPPPSFVPPPEVQIANPPAPPAPPRQAVAAQINVNACEKPEYPAAAARAEATGTTKIRFTVDAAGKVSKADIERSSGASREHRLLDRAAVEALSKCPFKPGTDETGKPVGATTLVEYVWKLE
jgi:protein TonB